MKKLSFFSVIVALTFMFGACNKNVPDQIFDEELGVNLKKAVETGFNGGLYTYGNITPPTYNSYGSDRFNNGEAWDLAFDLSKAKGKKFETQPPALKDAPGLVRVWRLENGNGPCYITFYLGISEYNCYNLAVRYAGGNNGNSGNGANGSGSTNLAWEFHTKGFDQLIMDGNFTDYLVVEKIGGITASKQGEYITFRLDYPLKVNVDNPWFVEDGEDPEKGEKGKQLPENVWNSEVMNPGNTHIAQINWGGPNAACGKTNKRKVVFTNPDTCEPIVVDGWVNEFFVECGKPLNHLEVGVKLGYWIEFIEGVHEWSLPYLGKNYTMSQPDFNRIFGLGDGCIAVYEGNPNAWKDCESDMFLVDLNENIPCGDGTLFLHPPYECPTPCETVKVLLLPGDGSGGAGIYATWDKCKNDCFGDWLYSEYGEADALSILNFKTDCRFAKFAGWGYLFQDPDSKIDKNLDCVIKDGVGYEGNGNLVIFALWDADCCPDIDVIFTSKYNPDVKITIGCDFDFDGCFGKWVNVIDQDQEFLKWQSDGDECIDGRIIGWKLDGKKVDIDHCGVPTPVNGQIVLEAIWECWVCENKLTEEPLDIIFVLDFSTSMSSGNPTKLAQLQNAAMLSINNIFATGGNHRVAVVLYGTGVYWRYNGAWRNNTTLYPLNKKDYIWMSAADANLFKTNPFTGTQYTNIMSGMNAARQILEGRTGNDAKRASAIVLMTDGQPNRYYTNQSSSNLGSTSMHSSGNYATAASVYYTIRNIEAVKNSISKPVIYTIGFDLDAVLYSGILTETRKDVQKLYALATIDPKLANLNSPTLSHYYVTGLSNLYNSLGCTKFVNPVTKCFLPYNGNDLQKAFDDLSKDMFKDCDWVTKK